MAEIVFELLKDINIGQLVGLAIIGWFFYSRLDKKFDAIDKKFEDVNKRFDKMDQRFDSIEEKVMDIDRRLCRMEGAFSMKECCRLSPDEIKKAG